MSDVPSPLYKLCDTECTEEASGAGRPGPAALELPCTKAATACVGRGIRQTGLEPQLLTFPTCVTLVNPGTSPGLHFLLCKWAKRVVVRLQRVTRGALGRTGGPEAVPRPRGSLGGCLLPAEACPLPWQLPSFLASPPPPWPEEAESPSPSVFPQKKIAPGLNHLCCFSLPSVCICLSGNETGKQMPCSRADVMRLGGASR